MTNNGADLTAIGDLASTVEYQSRFTGLSNEEIINSIYQSLFGRDGEPGGLAFFVAALENGTYNINNIAIAILDGAQGDDLATVNAKIAAANIFTAHLDLDTEVDAYAGAFAASVGRDFVNTVNKDDPGTESEADTAILRLFDQGQNPGGGNPPGGGGGGSTNTAPAFGQETYSFTKAENSTGSVGTVAATDVDAGDALTYALADDDLKLFSINSATGEISVNSAFNYETDQKSYDLTVTVKDQAGLEASTSVTVAIGDVNEAPAFGQETYTIEIQENTGASTGNNISASSDDGDEVTFSLRGHDDALIKIDPTSGVISLKQNLDFETAATKQFVFEVVATDEVGNQDTAAVTLNLMDDPSDNVTVYEVGPGLSFQNIAHFDGNDLIKIKDSDASTNIADNSGFEAGEFLNRTTAVQGNASNIDISNASQYGVISFATTLASDANLSSVAGSNGTELFQGLSSGGGNNGNAITYIGVSNNWTGFIVAYDNSNAYIYHANAAANNNGFNSFLAPEELSLVGVVQNVAVGGLTASEFTL